MRNILIVSAHPDDETLGCGGYLLKKNAEGNAISWVIATNINSDIGYSQEQITSRQQEINEVAKRYGIINIYKLDHPTAHLDTLPMSKLIGDLTAIVSDLKPEVILLPHHSDAHSDHRVLFQASMACTKSFRNPFIRQVMSYECISETEFSPAISGNAFIPNYFCDISDYLEKKLEIMKIYSSEIGKHPFPRSIKNIEALAVFRGAIAGVKYAEAFHLLKYIEH